MSDVFADLLIERQETLTTAAIASEAEVPTLFVINEDEELQVAYGEVTELVVEVDTIYELEEDQGFSITAEVQDNAKFANYVTTDVAEFFGQTKGVITLTIDGEAALNDVQLSNTPEDSTSTTSDSNSQSQSQAQDEGDSTDGASSSDSDASNQATESSSAQSESSQASGSGDSS